MAPPEIDIDDVTEWLRRHFQARSTRDAAERLGMDNQKLKRWLQTPETLPWCVIALAEAYGFDPIAKLDELRFVDLGEAHLPKDRPIGDLNYEQLYGHWARLTADLLGIELEYGRRRNLDQRGARGELFEALEIDREASPFPYPWEAAEHQEIFENSGDRDPSPAGARRMLLVPVQALREALAEPDEQDFVADRFPSFKYRLDRAETLTADWPYDVADRRTQDLLNGWSRALTAYRRRLRTDLLHILGEIVGYMTEAVALPTIKPVAPSYARNLDPDDSPDGY